MIPFLFAGVRGVWDGGVDAVWVLCCMSAVGTVVVSFFLGVPGRVGAACGLL